MCTYFFIQSPLGLEADLFWCPYPCITYGFHKINFNFPACQTILSVKFCSHTKNHLLFTQKSNVHTLPNFSLRKSQFAQPVSRDGHHREIWRPFRNLFSNRLKHSISRDFLSQSQEKVRASYSAPNFQYTFFQRRALWLLPQHMQVLG